MTAPDANLEESEVLTAAGSTQHAATPDDVCAWSLDNESPDAPEEAVEETPPRGHLTVALVALLAVTAAACATLLALGLPPFHAHGSQQQLRSDPSQNKALCELYDQVQDAVQLNTNMSSPDDTPTGTLAVAANARVALFVGAELLRQGLHDNPNASPNLSKKLGETASTLDGLVLGYLDNKSEDQLTPLRRDLDSEFAVLDVQCAPPTLMPT